jgi:enoyl-CoA hydratase/carnithine racemase
MTATDTNPRTAHNGRRSAIDDAPALVDQIVLSTAGTAAQGINTTLGILDGVVAAVDSLVSGAFDLAEQLANSNLVADLATKSIAAARQSWSTTVETSRQTLAQL